MSIFPLPMFEADADPSRRSEMSDAEIYARLKAPTSIVVRIGAMKHVGEYPYSGDAKPGCGSKLVARTERGTEVVDMLTTTCANSGCAKSVSRQDMLEYIDNSGGHDYPFHSDGQILRVATIDDLNEWARVQAEARERLKDVKRIVAASGLAMKVVDIEPILGQELVTVYFLSEERVDFRDLVRELASELHARIEMRQVGARDEARLVADYERCGQHCCCKNFLKVLKPVSMRSAKVQKATLDPLKISGRCGRLMCCLRYEDETYEDLKKRLPRNKTRVGTSEGPGLVVDSKILVQLVLVQLEHDGREIAVPVEELLDPETCPKPGSTPQPVAADPLRGLTPEDVGRRTGDRERAERSAKRREDQQSSFREESRSTASQPEPSRPTAPGTPPSPNDALARDATESTERKKRRRRRRGKSGDQAPSADGASITPSGSLGPPPSRPDGGRDSQPNAQSGEPEGGPRRRRRRRRGGRGGGGGGAGGGGPGSSPPSAS